MSKEPSMEEILSSIKRIIAEDNGRESAPAIRTGTRRASAERPRATKAESILNAIESGELDDQHQQVGYEEAGYNDGIDEDDTEILELTDAFDTREDVPPAPVAPPEPPRSPVAAATIPAQPAQPASAPRAAAPARPTPASAPPLQSAAIDEPAPFAVDSDAMLSVAAEVAARKALSSLTNMVVKPTGTPGDNTLENLVRDLLRPILKEWLDANLPDMVQTMVAREIARIAGRSE